MNKNSPLSLAFISLSIFFFLSFPALAQKKRPPAPVKVATAVMMEIAPVIEVSGTVISRDNAQLAAEVTGRVIWMAEVGQFVRKGEAVAQIDDKRLQLKKREADSKVKASRARIGYLRKESKRLTLMAKNQHTSQTVLEKTISDYDISLADLEATEAQLALIEDSIEKSRILAPFNGYVAERHKMPGEHVKVAEEVVHLVGIENIEIEASAPLMYVRYVKKGADLVVKSRDQQAVARVSSLVSIGTDQSRQFIMRLAINPHDDKQDWIPGMAVRVSVPTQNKISKLVIPRDAMVIRRDGTYVFRVKDDNTVERLLVTPGAAAEENIAITGNINAGDKVVIRGNERLRPGQKIKATSINP
ncbi:MAG: efflux RND transporter periplasmic adaptor subunit [Gammaproteobacteria bacterium]|nr:efflux RND transporter periplasmic adaptor subunit [Gammaproteobacteria bacterium]